MKNVHAKSDSSFSSLRSMVHLGCLVTGLFATSAVHAEQPGLSHGRLATPAAAAPSSAEIGARVASEFTYLGLRYNTRMGRRSTVFADVGTTRPDGQSAATTLGAGTYYYWGPISEWLDFSLKGAVHHIAGQVDTTYLGFDALFSSPDTDLLDRRWQWYAAIGLLRPLNRSESPDLSLSLGVVAPTRGGQVYAGIDVDDEALAVGYRFNLQ